VNDIEQIIKEFRALYGKKNGFLRQARMGIFSPEDPDVQILLELLKQIKEITKDQPSFDRNLINQLWYLLPWLKTVGPIVKEYSSTQYTSYNNFLSEIECLLGDIFGYPIIAETNDHLA
jgi:hypothetical protein